MQPTFELNILTRSIDNQLLMKEIPHVLKAVLCFSLLFSLLNGPVGAADEGLRGHWALAGDVKDSSGQGNDAVNHGADLSAPGPLVDANGAARFNGMSNFIEVDSKDSLHLGKGDFTFAIWVHTDSKLDDAIGDVLCKFDPVTRRGINLSIKNGAGTSGSQSNYRNVQFGIDSGTAPKWTDCGRPGNAVYVMALAVNEGELFAGTCEPGKDESGHVYRYDGGEHWVDCGSPDRSNAVTCLASFGGKLYAGTGRYRCSGSALPDSPNATPGGKVFRYEGNQRWSDCGQLINIDAVGGLVTFRGQLFATSLYHPTGMFRYSGDSEWLRCPLPKDGKRVVSPTVFNGNVYATSYDACAIYRFDGEKWFDPIQLEPSGQTYSVEVHNGALYAGTWPNGRVYRSDDGERWTDAGRLGHENEVMGMAVYNGKLYAGTLPLAQVYRYDDGSIWTYTGQLDHTPDVRYRRAWSMAIYQGKLFCGTLPSGHVHALEAGSSVSYDRELPLGWRHIAAIRENDHLKLFIDGKLVGTSTPLPQGPLDVSNDQPLKIGFGGHDYFRGSLCDVRVYARAVSADEIVSLMNAHGKVAR
jgi:hypothetical protein